MEVQSYIGAPTIVDKKLFGLVALLDVQSISDPEYYTSLIDFIASRVSIELERYTNKCQVEKLTKLANTDPLTGLLNRAAFTKAVSDTLFDYQNLAVLFIDADFFKKINDLFGHQKGDDVLVMLGHIFIKCVREGDVVARYGGEEFVIYLPGANKSSAMSVANRIHAYLQKNEVHPLTVSIGVAISTSGEEIDKLLSKADSAVYEAKSKGRNQTVVFGE